MCKMSLCKDTKYIIKQIKMTIQICNNVFAAFTFVAFFSRV